MTTLEPVTTKGSPPPPKYEAVSKINEKGKATCDSASESYVDYLKLENVKSEHHVSVPQMAEMLAQFANLFTGKAVALDTEIRQRQIERQGLVDTIENQRVLIQKLNLNVKRFKLLSQEAGQQRDKVQEKLDDVTEKADSYQKHNKELKGELEVMTEKAERYKDERKTLREDVEALTDTRDHLQRSYDRQLEQRELIRRGRMCFICDSRNHWTRGQPVFDRGNSVMAHCRAARDEAHMKFCSGDFEDEDED